MTNSQHTPGPWEHRYTEECYSDSGTGRPGEDHQPLEAYVVALRKDRIGQKFTLCKVDGFSDEEKKANARLIAKAPEMLGCLRELIEADDSNDANIMHVVAIKAELLLRDIESNT